MGFNFGFCLLPQLFHPDWGMSVESKQVGVCDASISSWSPAHLILLKASLRVCRDAAMGFCSHLLQDLLMLIYTCLRVCAGD